MIAPNIIWGVWSPDTNPNTVFEGVWSCRDSESGLAPRRDPETDPILSHWAISGRRSRIFQRWIYTCVPANDEYRHWCPSWTHPFHAQGALGLHMGIRAQLEGRNMARRGSDCQPNYGHVTMDPCPSWAVFFLGGQNCKKKQLGWWNIGEARDCGWRNVRWSQQVTGKIHHPVTQSSRCGCEM